MVLSGPASCGDRASTWTPSPGIKLAAFGVVAFGLARRRSWAWFAGLVIGVVSVLGGIGQYRGAASLVGILMGAALVGLLLVLWKVTEAWGAEDPATCRGCGKGTSAD